MAHEIEPRQLSAAMERGERVVLVDVRQEWEHDAARIPGSVLLPLHELPARVAELEIPEGATVVVYCHHGVRSLAGAAILGQAGISALSLAGGIDAWSREVDPGVPRY